MYFDPQFAAVTSCNCITSRTCFTDSFWRRPQGKILTKCIPSATQRRHYITISRCREIKSIGWKKTTHLIKLFKKLRINLPAELRNGDKWSTEDLHGKDVQVAAPVHLSLRSGDRNNRRTPNTAVQDHLRFSIWALLIDRNSHFAFYCPTLHSRRLKIPSVHNSQGKRITHNHFVSRRLRVCTWQMSWRRTGQMTCFSNISGCCYYAI